jgi:hypothetical protein
MKILGYGEDALTLWALKYKLPTILEELDDKSSLSECRVLFRPSFGRSGGENSAQFGEFDFLLMSKRHLYLGESKWQRSSEKIINGVIGLREEQLLRHEILRLYVEEWMSRKYISWLGFEKAAKTRFREDGINKPIAPADSLLAQNLETVLDVIKEHFEVLPTIKNVLLYLYYGSKAHLLPKSAGRNFVVVNIDCSDGVKENFVDL